MLTIKILGAGCPNCEKLAKRTRDALDPLGISYELIKVTDYTDIADYGVLQTPGLVVNERVVSVGRIPRKGEIVTWATEAIPE